MDSQVTPRRTVLSLNCGSSSLKADLYAVDTANDVRALAHFDTWEAVADIADEPFAVGHRIVFGGLDHTEPALASDELLEVLDGLTAIEPLHLPSELALCRRARARFSNAAHVLCFDTAFHRQSPPIAHALPLPAIDPMLRRYGFHGLSYEYIATRLPPGERVVVAHLGSGASLCAMYDRKPLDTTMGFTALGGVMMASRPGDLDPGILLYLLERGYDAARLRDLLARNSGLLGVSQRSGDLRELIEASANDADAGRAIDLYVYQLVKAFGAMTSVLGGVDRIVFTGGVGEHAALIRTRICDGLAYLGVGSTVPADVIPTDENRMIARHVLAVAR